MQQQQQLNSETDLPPNDARTAVLPPTPLRPGSDGPSQSPSEPQIQPGSRSVDSKRKQTKPRQWLLQDYDTASMQSFDPVPGNPMPVQPIDASGEGASSPQQQPHPLEPVSQQAQHDQQPTHLYQHGTDSYDEADPFAVRQPSRPSWRVSFADGFQGRWPPSPLRQESEEQQQEHRDHDHWSMPPADTASSSPGAEGDAPPTPIVDGEEMSDQDDYDQWPVVHGHLEGEEDNPFAVGPGWLPPERSASVPDEEDNPFAAPPAIHRGAQAGEPGDQTEHPATPASAEAQSQHSHAIRARSIDDDTDARATSFAPAAAAAAVVMQQ